MGLYEFKRSSDLRFEFCNFILKCCKLLLCEMKLWIYRIENADWVYRFIELKLRLGTN